MIPPAPARLIATSDQAPREINEVVPDHSARVIPIRRRVIQTVSDRAVHIDEDVFFRERVLRMIPHEDGWVPQIGGSIGGMEIFEHIVSDDPVVSRMDA